MDPAKCNTNFLLSLDRDSIQIKWLNDWAPFNSIYLHILPPNIYEDKNKVKSNAMRSGSLSPDLYLAYVHLIGLLDVSGRRMWSLAMNHHNDVGARS